MPSPACSLERLTRVGPWPRVWLLAAVLAATALGGQELAWRAAGYPAAVSDGMDLWSYWREQVEQTGPDTVVLLGDSRIAWSFDLEAFRQAWPNFRAVQLYVPAARPLAALRDLAESEQFAGIVICAIQEEGLLAEHWDEQQPYVDYYHSHWTVEKSIDRRIRTALEERLVLLNPELHPRYLIKGLFGRWPRRQLWRTRADRSCPADFTLRSADDLADLNDKLARVQARELAPLAEIAAELWLERVRQADELVRRIQDRGGQVVFTRFVTSGGVLEAYQSGAPRERFWDVLAANTRAVTVHFQDVPGLREFHCPDGVHLDFRDAGEYTRRFAAELARRGVLRESPSGQ